MELLKLVEKAQEGDKKAIHEVCLRFANLVKKYALQPHIRPIFEEAEAQGWLALVQSIKEYDAGSGVPFAGYAESRVKYAIWNLFKRERRRWQQEDQLEGDYEEDGLSLLDRLAHEGDVAREVELRYVSQELVKAMTALPDKQRQVILRTVVGDERLTELAMEIGITVQGIYNLRKRGLARLKNLCFGMYKDIRR